MNNAMVQTYQMQIPAILSCLATGSIILTCTIFSELRNLRYIRLVLYMAINDLIASIGVALGDVSSGSIACWFQGLVTNANYLSSCFWTVLITYQLWSVVTYKKNVDDQRLIHAFCWIFPWVLALLPLSTFNLYGEIDDGSSWCFIISTRRSPFWSILFWEFFSFYIWILGSIIVMSFLLLDVGFRMQSSKTATSDLVMKTIRKLSLYPIVLTLCWIPSLVVDFIYATPAAKGTNHLLMNAFGNIFPATQGIFAGLIFFTQNEIVREKWSHFVVERCCFHRAGVDDDSFFIEDGISSKSECVIDALRETFGIRPSSSISAPLTMTESRLSRISANIVFSSTHKSHFQPSDALEEKCKDIL